MATSSAHDPGSGRWLARPTPCWTLVWPLLMALTAARSLPARGQSEPVHEHQLKGEFIERFTRFVQWPAGALPADDRPLQVCVMGVNAVGDEILRMARVRLFNGRRAEGRRLSARADVSACHLLFLGFQERSRLDDLLPQLVGRPVLTISDAPGFGERGVLINFYRDVTRVRFEINIAAVQQSGLNFRAQLLRLGRQVGAESSLRKD
jgi:hypothetical protein